MCGYVDGLRGASQPIKEKRLGQFGRWHGFWTSRFACIVPWTLSSSAEVGEDKNDASEIGT